MNKLKNVVRAISPFSRDSRRSSAHDIDQAGNNLYEESRWQQKVANLDIRHFMEIFYRRYNPEKAHTIDFILEQFSGRENDMLLMLTDKYGVSREEAYGLMDRAQKTVNSSSRQPPPPPAAPHQAAQAAPPPAPRGPNTSAQSQQQQRAPGQPAPPPPRPVPREEDNRSVSSYVSGLNSMRAGQSNSNRPGHSDISNSSNGQQINDQTLRDASKPMSHREVNQSLKGVIFEVRKTGAGERARGQSHAAPSPVRNPMASSVPQQQQPALHRSPETSDPDMKNRARLRSILDTESEDSRPTQSVPFASSSPASRLHSPAQHESSSGGEEFTESEIDEEELRNPEYKYDYADADHINSNSPQLAARRKHQSPGGNRIPPAIGTNTAHPHLSRHESHSPHSSNHSNHHMNGSLRSLGGGIGEAADGSGTLAADLEQARVALASSKNEKGDMLKLLEMMASNPGNINGAIAEFVRTHESARAPAPETAGPFVLGHHSRFNNKDNESSPVSIGDNSSRGADRYHQDLGGSSHVLNLSDLHGRHSSLEQDMASLASAQTGRSVRSMASRDRGDSAPHMRHTKASDKREADIARDAKSSGRYVPYHDPSSPLFEVTRARSPAPGVSRSSWTGVTPSDEDLQRLQRRSTSSTPLYRGRTGHDGESSSWGEQPRTLRASSPSGYDVRRNNPRAASPTPSVRSMDSNASYGSLNARNVANRYSSPSPSVRSNASARSGGQSNASRVPGRAPSDRGHSPLPGPSGGGRLYFKESNTNSSTKFTGNTNNSSSEAKDKERTALLEEQYRLAKKYLDHGMEQARVSQKMAELKLKSSTHKMSAHMSDAIASVEHDVGQDDWVECFDSRTKRKYFYSKSRKASSWTKPLQESFNWSHNPKSDAIAKKQATNADVSLKSRSSTPTKAAAINAANNMNAKKSIGKSDGASTISAEKKNKPEWRMVKDEKSGRNYWYNRATRATTWYDPYKTKEVEK